MIEVLKQMQEALPCCGYTDASAVKWNPLNGVVQCHNCGQTYTTPQRTEQEPVAHSVIAGVLFDFMGWLTSRKERIVLSSADNASPAVEAITEFAKMRNLSLDDAKVQDWHTHPPQRTEQEPVAWRTFDGEGQYEYRAYEDNESYVDDWNKRNPNHKGWVEPLYTHPPQRTWVGLTEDDKVLIKHDANFNQFMTAGEYADRVQQLTEARLKDKNT